LRFHWISVYCPCNNQYIDYQYWVDNNHCILCTLLCGCVNHLSPNILNALIYWRWLCLFVLLGT
jgi:hypothetical protein